MVRPWCNWSTYCPEQNCFDNESPRQAPQKQGSAVAGSNSTGRSLQGAGTNQAPTRISRPSARYSRTRFHRA